MRLLHHDSALTGGACIPHTRPRVVRVTINQTYQAKGVESAMMYDAHFGASGPPSASIPDDAALLALALEKRHHRHCWHLLVRTTDT
jgi:hypothetical protein